MQLSLDIEQPEQLLAYLVSTRRIERTEQPSFSVLTGGVSNRTVWVERANGEAWVMKQALAKLRVKVDWFSSPERIHREALAMTWLAQLAPPDTIVPLVFEDQANHILAMQAVPQPHANWKTLLLAGDLQLDHIAQFAQLLAMIQRKASLRQHEIEPIFADRTFFETLRVEPYYSYTASLVPESAAFYESLITDTRQALHTLVHGDYSPKNVLVYNNQLVLLDHEVIHWGDPAFDLGFSLAHLLSKAHHLLGQRQQFADAALYYWQTYLQTLADVDWLTDLETRAVRHTLGCLLARVAGRSQMDYFGDAERQHQQRVVIGLMKDGLSSMADLLEQFVEGLRAK